MKKQLMTVLLILLLLASMTPFVTAEEEDSAPFVEEGEYTDNTDGSYDDGSYDPEEPDGGEPEGEEMTLEELLGIDMGAYPKTMYVRTDDGGTLNVRSEPKVGNNKIGKLQYGAAVTVLGPVVINADWSVIQFASGPDGVGYVMTRYLSSSKPSSRTKKKTNSSTNNTQTTKKKKKNEISEHNLEQLNKELASAKMLEKPILAKVRTPRASGWISFRVGPGIGTEQISQLQDGQDLKIIGETKSWYQVIDLATGKTGYVSKSYVGINPVQPEPETQSEPEKPAKEQMGKLNVNGEFSLQCQLPEGYTMQLINTLGTRIAAFITSEDAEKPVLQLSIVYNELYSDVKRMNDLSQEALELLEQSFTDQNDVEITYRETAYGTKLLIAKEVGTDADFVDILSVYMGYSIEFVMSPNPKAKDQTLTEEQIQMCIDFLSELDFVPAVEPSSEPAPRTFTFK